MDSNDLIPLSVPPMPAVPPAQRESPTFAYLSGLAPGSRKSMYYALRSMAALVTGSPEASPYDVAWWQLDAMMISGLRARLAASLAPATARRFLSGLRGVLHECWRQGLLSHDEFKRLTDITPIKGSRLPAGRMLTAGEVATLFARATVTEAAALAVMLFGGLRRSEAASLTPADVVADGTGAKITVLGKGNKQREVFLADRVAALVLPLAEGERAHGRSGVPLLGPRTGNGIWRMLDRLCKRTGIAPFTPHDLRRTCVSQALDLGVDLATVQQMVGHADPRTTARYDRRGQDAQRAAASKLAESLGS